MLAAFLILLGALVLRAGDPGGLARLRDLAFDSMQRLHPRPYSTDFPVRIVDIDEAALAEYGQWPWPRTVLAKLVDKLTEKGAAVIAFDAVFAEADRTSLSHMVHDLIAYTDPETVKKIQAQIQDNDTVFAAAIAASRVVLGFGFDLAGTAKPPKRFYGVVTAGDDPLQFLPAQAGTVKALDLLEAAAKGNGSVNTDLESVVIRRVPMLFRLNGQPDIYPALSIEALRVAQGASTYLIKSSNSSGEQGYGESTGIVAIKVGALQVRTDFRGRVTLYDTGHQAGRFVSAKDVLKDMVPADKLDGQVVFIGTSAIGLKDLRNTPIQDSVPGIEIHAQIAEQILTQDFLARPDFADGLEFIYLAVLGLVVVWLLPRLSAGRMAVVTGFFVIVGLGAPWYAFTELKLLFDPVYPPATLAAMYVGGTALAFMKTERERAQIRGAFGLYLSPSLVEQLARNPKLLQLGGEMREITVMFTDVRGFTTISEQFDPHGLTRFMNNFLTPMTDLILGKQGTIDKYMGDAIMAFWNAPLAIEAHALRACDTALAMQARLRDLNVEWQAEAEREDRKHIPVKIGVGLNTGDASVGNFGSTQRFTYSCLGDAVNLASRLEGQCKTYGVDIVIGEKTRLEVPDMAVIELDLIMVKGKTAPERMYALLGDAILAQSRTFLVLQRQHLAFLEAYRLGGFAEALAMIADCAIAADAAGWHQSYYDMMRDRVDGLIDDSPADWMGVYVAKEK